MQHQQKFVHCVILALCVLLSACAAPKKKSASKAAPSNKAELNLQMGARYLELGMLDVAKEKLEKAVELDDRNADSHNALAVLYQRLQKMELAERHFSEAVKLDPENFGLLNNFGRFLCLQNKYDKGLVLLNQAQENPLNNRKWFALTNMGLCYKAKLDVDQAEGVFRQALQANPRFSPALVEMQQISFSNRKYMSARAFLERYLEVAEHTEQSLWTAIQTERAVGNQSLSESYIRQLLTKFPASPFAQRVRQMNDQ